MHLTAKIKKLAKNRGWSLKELHKKLESIYGDQAVSYFTLSRLGKDVAKIRPKTIHQVCAVLGVSKEVLLNDAAKDEELTDNAIGMSGGADVEYTRLCYSEGAYFELLSAFDGPHQCLRLVLNAGAKTNLTQGHKGCVKRLYVLEGRLTVYVGNKRCELKKDAFFEFDSFLPHQFENAGGFVVRCLIEEYQ